MYGCGYQEVGVVGRRRVWLVGGMYGCGYQEVGVVGRRRVWLAGGMYGCGYCNNVGPGLATTDYTSRVFRTNLIARLNSTISIHII